MTRIQNDTPYETPQQASSSGTVASKYNRSAAGWVIHPVLRGVCAELIADASPGFVPGSGFVFGALSGLTNLALQPVFKRIDERVDSDEGRAANYLLSATSPWVASAALMRQGYKAHGSSILRINPRTAMTTAITSQVLSFLFTRTNER